MTNINQSKIKKATKVFNSVFNKYDIMNDLMSLGIHRLWKKRLIEWMNPKKDDHLIDMAARTGDIANAFLSRIKNQGYVSCVDPNKLMIEQGRKKLKYLNNIQWHVSSAENLPFKDNIFDIYYEDLISDPDNKIKGLIKFCDVEWDDNCLNFHKNKKTVATASLAQVRKPIYKSSIKQWENYKNDLDPLKKIITQSLKKH